jgi:hypothetical protein
MSNRSKIHPPLRALTKLEERGLSRHTIRLHGDGHVIENLELVAAYDGERDKFGTLVSQGGVEWRTEKGKKFFCKYSEFSFLINNKKAA